MVPIGLPDDDAGGSTLTLADAAPPASPGDVDGGSGHQPDAAEPPGSSGTPGPQVSSDPVDVTVIPAEVTASYLDAVLAELEVVWAGAMSELLDHGDFTIDVTDGIGEVFAPHQFDFRVSTFRQALEEFPEIFRPRDEFGQRQRRVLAIHDEAPGCLWLETELDWNDVLVEPIEPEVSFVRLTDERVERPVVLNPTPWVFDSLEFGDADELRRRRPCS